MSTDTPLQEITIGVDIGGTFTDFVIYRPESGSLETFKLLSTPQDPAEAVLRGLETLGISKDTKSPQVHILHGSTVATNALLERKGARTAFVATHGFSDLLQIGRQNRPYLYDLFADPPPTLVPEELRFEVRERVDRDGVVLQSLDPAQVDVLISELEAQEVESAAICLLFSFLYPAHEQMIAEKLRQAGFFVSPSHEILPEYREYERASTTAVNAYVSPVLDRYLSHMEEALSSEVRLRVMQSNGGGISPEEARRHGARCILSGPAGGVVGSQYVAELALSSSEAEGASTSQPPSFKEVERDRVRVITFDMGGTSTDVSLIDGTPGLTSEAQVGGCPIRLPMLDIHTIGAGGGSIARLDPGGALRVGPQSAGADPGPACYGVGILPTVTDANLVLGRLDPEHFLGGKMPLYPERAWKALAGLGREMGLSPQEAALGVVKVVNAHMERALRVISVERGHDPQGGGGLPPFTLLTFGGAGGLHSADLARSLGIPQVLVPPLASTLSAFGMLVADLVKDYSQTVMLPGDTPHSEIIGRLGPLVRRGQHELNKEGIPPERVHIEQTLDVRYQGQSYELNLPLSQDFLATFHALHRQSYGYHRPDAPTEIVNLRLRAIGRVEKPALDFLPAAGPDPERAFLGYRPVTYPSGELEVPFYQGERLQPGNRFLGPAIVIRSDTTILVGEQDWASVDSYGDLVIQIQERGLNR